jgi:hypothetical protein
MTPSAWQQLPQGFPLAAPAVFPMEIPVFDLSLTELLFVQKTLTALG